MDLRLSVSERLRWELAAKSRGVSLSSLIRLAVEADLNSGTQQGASGGLPAVSEPEPGAWLSREQMRAEAERTAAPVYAHPDDVPAVKELLARIPPRAFRPDPRPVPTKKGRR